jgi:hypothetical protein
VDILVGARCNKKRILIYPTFYVRRVSSSVPDADPFSPGNIFFILQRQHYITPPTPLLFHTMERGRPREPRHGSEQHLYGETNSPTPPASPVRRTKHPEAQRNKRIANAYGTSMVRPKYKKNTGGGTAARARSRSNSREPTRRTEPSTNSSRTKHQRTHRTEPRKPIAHRHQSPPSPNNSRRRKSKTIEKGGTGSHKHKSAEEHILAATNQSRAINETDSDLDYASLQNYIEELKHKMGGSGGTNSSVSVHQLSKVKRRIMDAMTHEQRVAAMLKQGAYKPSSNLMKGAMPTRKKHVAKAHAMEPKHFRKKSAGVVYNQQLLRSSGNGGGGDGRRNQWGNWLDSFEAESFKWFERQATYCRPGPASGKMVRAFNNYGKRMDVLLVFICWFSRVVWCGCVLTLWWLLVGVSCLVQSKGTIKRVRRVIRTPVSVGLFFGSKGRRKKCVC